MPENLHELIHLWSDLQKNHEKQLMLLVEQGKLLDRIGKIYDEMIKNEPK